MENEVLDAPSRYRRMGRAPARPDHSLQGLPGWLRGQRPVQLFSFCSSKSHYGLSYRGVVEETAGRLPFCRFLAPSLVEIAPDSATTARLQGRLRRARLSDRVFGPYGDAETGRAGRVHQGGR